MNWDTVRQDLAYSLRTLRNSPTFAITAVLTLALGIGANTAIFSVIHAVLLKPLEYPHAEQLVRITGGATDARFQAIRQARSYSNAAAFNVFNETVALAGPANSEAWSEALQGVRVTANFLPTLGLKPLHGRGFLAEEEMSGHQVAMISAELWQRRFGGDPRIVGSTVTLAAAPYTIIGVLPPGLALPLPGLDVWRPWQPQTLPMPVRLNSPILGVFGRLKPGITVQQANAELSVINRQYAVEHRGALDARPDRLNEVVTPLKDYLVRDVRSILWMLFGAVGLLLLMACANVAGLILARSAARTREFAVRAALGAGRGRLISQQLTESLLLALAGGAAGVLLAWLSLSALTSLPGLELPRAGEIRLNPLVLAFALSMALLTSVIIGLAPAFSASRPDLAVVMKATGEASAIGWHHRLALWLRPRGMLVAAQVALSLILLAGAALLIESLASLSRVQPGFEPRNLLSMQITLPQARHQELVRRVESIPGVEAAAITLTLPMTGYAGTPVQAAGEPLMKLNERPIAILQTVTPGYFRTLGIPMRNGRDFTLGDTATTALVAIVNDSLARRFWPGQDPVGRHLLIGSNPSPVLVTAVVADVRQAGLAADADPGVYRPRTQTPEMPAMFAVRTAADPLHLVKAIRHELAAIDANQAIAEVKTMLAVVDASENQRRSIMTLLTLFAATGLLLVIVGIYGVMAYSVGQRTREMGIRRALGAPEGHILWLVLAQGLSLAIAGVTLGLAGAVALTRAMQGLLYRISPTDPLTLGGVAFVLILVTIAASYLPARRAIRASPTAAMNGL